MSEKISVSVLMYVKNGMPYIVHALQSVIDQTLKSIEILVIDSGSTDGTLDAVSDLMQKDDRIRLLHCDKASSGAQFNMGLKNARGEYIGIVESDDYILPEMYEREYQAAKEAGCDVLRADCYAFFESQGREIRFRNNVSHDASTYGRNLCAKDDPDRVLIGGSIWTGLYRREFLLDNEIFESETRGAAYQDFGLLFLSSVLADSVYFLNEAYYCYRKDNAFSSCNNPIGIDLIDTEFGHIRSELERRGLWGKYKKYYYLWKIRNERWFYRNLRESDKGSFIDHVYPLLSEELADDSVLDMNWNKKEREFVSSVTESKDKMQKYLEKDDDSWNRSAVSLLEIDEAARVYIFGAGNLGEIIARLLKEKGVSVVGITDNNRSLWGEQVAGIRILSPDEAVKDKKAVFVVCSENYAEEIEEQLRSNGLAQDRIIICNDMDSCYRLFMRDEIKNLMCDDVSSYIYEHRLKHSLTHSEECIDAIVGRYLRRDKQWTDFLKILQDRSANNEMVLFGAGIWGETLLSETQDRISWKCVIDGSATQESIHGISVINREGFLRDYHGEIVVISSHKHLLSMSRQLEEAGVPDDNIIDAGSVIYELTEGRIYFDNDVPGLINAVKNIDGAFVDGGTFDGSDTDRFLALKGGNGFSYCFEPDSANVVRIKERLKGNEDCYRIVPKALWSSNTTLMFDNHGDFSSRIAEGNVGESIPAGCIDEEVGDNRVSFIKMDIEGAELEALRGAAGAIKHDHPILAISVYHKPEDIWTIPAYIHSLHEGYRLYLRHYSFSWYDTVLYAIPQEIAAE